MTNIERQLICRFGGGGGGYTPPLPPAPPSKDTAAQNLLQQGMKKPPVGFDSTVIGDNNQKPTTQRKTLLGE